MNLVSSRSGEDSNGSCLVEFPGESAEKCNRYVISMVEAMNNGIHSRIP
jgi:hypothetical protein